MTEIKEINMIRKKSNTESLWTLVLLCSTIWGKLFFMQCEHGSGWSYTYPPPCLPRECQGEHIWPWSALPSSPILGHSHWSRGGIMTQAVSILPHDFSAWSSRSKDLAFWVTKMGGLGAAGNPLSCHLEKRNPTTGRQWGDTRRAWGALKYNSGVQSPQSCSAI